MNYVSRFLPYEHSRALMREFLNSPTADIHAVGFGPSPRLLPAGTGNGGVFEAEADDGLRLARPCLGDADEDRAAISRAFQIYRRL